MARINVYVPDELVERARSELPDQNWSAVMQAAIRWSLDECDHDRLSCSLCARELHLADIVGEARYDVFQELWSVIYDLDRARLVTPELLAARLRKIGERMAIPDVDQLPTPRPSREQYEARQRARGEEPRRDARRRVGAEATKAAVMAAAARQMFDDEPVA